MPRKTYDQATGRRRPHGNAGEALAGLQREMARSRPVPPLSASDVEGFTHRPDCRGSSVTAFNGSRGDLMARCHSCNALAPIDPKENR